MALLFQTTLILLIFKNLNAEFFTSNEKMLELVETHGKVTEQLRNFIEQHELTSALDDAKE